MILNISDGIGVTRQGCMLSYIMEMVKSSDDTDHLTIPGHCLSIGDQCVTNG